MIFIKRAFEYLKKKIGKTVLLAFIFIVIANFIIAGLLIQNASENAQTNTRLEIGADITYEANFDTLFADFEKGTIKRSDVAGLKSGGLVQLDAIDNGGGPTVANMEQVIDSEYVKTYHFGIQTAIESNINVYQIEAGVPDTQTFTFEGYGANTPLDDTQKNISLVKGNYPSSEEIANGVPVLMISQSVADKNNLDINDIIEIDFNQIEGSEKTNFEVVGIYQNNTTTTQVNNASNLFQNKIYAPYTVFETIGMEESLLNKTLVVNTLIQLNDPENLDLFRAEAEEKIDFNYGILNANDDLYNSLVGPIESIGLITQIFVVSIIITGGFIVGLITALTINDRKNEIGILLAVGESKFKIVSQFVLEVVVIAVLAFSLSLFTGEILGENLSNTLLDSEVFGETETVQSISVGKMRPGNQATVKKDFSSVKEAADLKIGLDLATIMQIFGIGLVLTIVSTSIPTIYVMRFSPKQILTNRDS